VEALASVILPSVAQQRVPDHGFQSRGRFVELGQVPSHCLSVIGVEMCLNAIEANIDHGFSQAFGQTGLPIRSGVFVGQIGDQKSAAPYLVLNNRIDVTSLLRDDAELEARVCNGLFEAPLVKSVQLVVPELTRKEGVP